MSIGNRIKLAREAAGMSQQELGSAVGVSRAAVAQWESSSTKDLKNENLFNVADALGLDPRALVFDKNKTKTNKKNDSKYELIKNLNDVQIAALKKLINPVMDKKIRVNVVLEDEKMLAECLEVYLNVPLVKNLLITSAGEGAKAVILLLRWFVGKSEDELSELIKNNSTIAEIVNKRSKNEKQIRRTKGEPKTAQTSKRSSNR